MDGAQLTLENQPEFFGEYEAALADLDAAKDGWARSSLAERIGLLTQMKHTIMQVAKDWAETSARNKGLSAGTPVAGEEWITGPYATMAGVNGLLHTLSQMPGKAFADKLRKRELPTGQLAVQVLPASFWDHLLFSGVRAEAWMLKGVTRDNLKDHAATAYDQPEAERKGKVALVLGAGNVTAITPLDVMQKLIVENQVVILKMNPINDYLTDHYKIAMKPLIDAGALRIVRGDAAGGAYLGDHPLVEELHITGSDKTHDAIVWGVGQEGESNRKQGTPRNPRRITSELGSVSPTIVVPGPWSAADIRYQAEHIATMKLHNSGHNCIACQALIMPGGWDLGSRLMHEVRQVATRSTRPTWYPGTGQRLQTHCQHGGAVRKVGRGDAAPPLVISDLAGHSHNRENEVFGPALGTVELDAPDPETYLRAAIAYANDALWGTLGANILIHPRTISKIGKARFELIVAELKYGTIAVNAWCGMGFLITTCPWGAYPGHTPDDIQSGSGTVHNTFMLENTERVVLRAPWRPFPRGLLSLQFTLLPRPPFFITNKRQHKIGRALTEFQYKPNWRRLPGILCNALLG